MGSDDLFKKRNKSSARKFGRNHTQRNPYTNITIICEGTKSEPIYLQTLSDDLNLHRRRIVIRPCRLGNDPCSIIDDAIETYQNQSSIIDHIYCVFDRDGHANFDDTLQKCFSQTNYQHELRINLM